MASEARRSPAGPVDITVVVPDGADAGLSPAVAGGLYRVAQQAVVNAMRHARARRVTVHLTRADGEIRLRVDDDGAGFEPTDVPSDRFGLVGMRERARLLGGSLTVESAPDAGTAIEVRVPIAVRHAGRGQELP
jgi:two-component system NarL family sensor kinase